MRVILFLLPTVLIIILENILEKEKIDEPKILVSDLLGVSKNVVIPKEKLLASSR